MKALHTREHQQMEALLGPKLHSKTNGSVSTAEALAGKSASPPLRLALFCVAARAHLMTDECTVDSQSPPHSPPVRMLWTHVRS